MNRAENAVLVILARWLTPLGALFAFTLLANWPAGGGVGFTAGLAMALPVALNALIFGVRSVLAAIPAIALRAVLAIGLAAAFIAAGVPNFVWSAQIAEAGAFAASASGISIATLVLMGRAGALKDQTW